MFSHLLDRMREPSTYAGLTGLLAVFGVSVDPGLMQQIIATVAGVSGLIAMLMGDNKN